MLGKLLKYELKSTGRVFGAIYAIILVLSAVMGILGRTFLRDGVYTLEAGYPRVIAMGILMAAYIGMIIAMGIVTFVVILERFYRNLLKGEGYLMHTLPVPTWMLVAGKLISAVIWNVLAVLVVLLSFVIIMVSGGLLMDVLPNLSSLLHNLLWIFDSANIRTVGVAAYALLSAVSGILLFYVSMAIGGAAKRHKKTCSILVFIGILILCTVIEVALGNIWGGTAFAIGASEKSMMIWNSVVNGIYCVVFFGLTTLFLQKRLNLE